MILVLLLMCLSTQNHILIKAPREATWHLKFTLSCKTLQTIMTSSKLTFSPLESFCFHWCWRNYRLSMRLQTTRITNSSLKENRRSFGNVILRLSELQKKKRVVWYRSSKSSLFQWLNSILNKDQKWKKCCWARGWKGDTVSSDHWKDDVYIS